MSNFLVTGQPGSGKTTVVEKVADSLRERGLEVGGVYSPEIREGGERIGFRIVDVRTDEGDVMAHTDYGGPKVGKYGVDVSAVDRVSKQAFQRAFETDAVVVDEIAPMEVVSPVFKDGVKQVLDSGKPVIAAIHFSSESGFIGDVKRRSDTVTMEVTEETRDDLPMRLVAEVLDVVGE